MCIWISLPLVTLTGYAYFGPLIEVEELPGQPCSQQSLQSQCYSVEKNTCMSAWNYYAQMCHDEVKKMVRPDRSTWLMGPSIQRCIRERFDKTLRYTRRTTTSTCANYFTSLNE